MTDIWTLRDVDNPERHTHERPPPPTPPPTSQPTPSRTLNHLGVTMKKSIPLAAVALAAVALTGCTTDADVASRNVSLAAEQFEVQRLIVGVNGITDEVLFSVEGRCSIEMVAGPPESLQVICKHGENDFRKHYVGLSDNVTFVSTQLEAIDVSVYHTRIVLKPQNIVPDFDLTVGER